MFLSILRGWRFKSVTKLSQLALISLIISNSANKTEMISFISNVRIHLFCEFILITSRNFTATFSVAASCSVLRGTEGHCTPHSSSILRRLHHLAVNSGPRVLCRAADGRAPCVLAAATATLRPLRRNFEGKKGVKKCF